MKIILEGPDGAGKTELALKLKKMYPELIYKHHGVYPNHTGQELLDLYTSSLLEHEHVLLDRCYLSEYVYGNIMRGEDRLGYQGRQLLDRFCQARGIQTIICLPPWPTVKKNWKKKVEDYTESSGHLHKIYMLYHLLWSVRPRILLYDYTKANRFDFDILAEKDNYALPAPAIGFRFAEQLIVGEQINRKKSVHDLPFYLLSGSSKFFYECIARGGFQRSLVLVNAVKASGEVTDKHRHRRTHKGENDLWAIVDRMPNFQIAVALGKTAARVCSNQGIPFVKIPHPAYWQRFRGADQPGYFRLLKETINARPITKLLRRMDTDVTGSSLPGARMLTPRPERKRATPYATGRHRSSK